MKVVIVGGVAGGASAATRIRRGSEAAEVVVFERGPDISFVNCGLPYFVGGHFEDRDGLIAETPGHLRERYRVDVRVRTEVRAIDRLAKTVQARDLDTGREYDEPYDKLVLSPGATPIRPDVPGADLDGVFTLRDVGDAERIKAAVDRGARRAVVVGGGYIGLEMAENLAKRGVATTLIQSRDQVLDLLDREMTTPVARALVKNGVELVLNEKVVGFARVGDGLAVEVEVEVEGGRRFGGDFAVVGVGVKPESWLARDAGLALGESGGIVVDAHQRTSDPDIYAVGDAVETADFVLGGSTWVALAGPANRQSRVAVAHLLGRSDARYRGSQGTIIVGLFGVTAGATGAGEAALVEAKRPHRKVYVHANNHSGYIPGAEQLTLKVLFDPDSGRILGAQAVGGPGTDKRLDVLATAIQAGLTAFDLEDAELAYAPQFGAANDPVNLAGFAAAGILRGDAPQVDVEAILDAPPDDRPFVLDVRTPEEFAEGTLPGAVNIPLDDLRDRLDEVPRGRPVAVSCSIGKRSAIATRLLLQHGVRAATVGGGYKTYRLHHPDGPGAA